MSEAFFFFGSLRDPLILEAVIGRGLTHLTFEAGWLAGHRVERAMGYSFPLLAPDPSMDAAGLVTWGLTVEDRRRIAYFEDSEYELHPKTIRTSTESLTAHVYLGSDKLRSSGEPWELSDFQENDRQLLLAVTQFVMREHYPTTPQAQVEELWGSIRDRIARELGVAHKP